MLNPPVKVHSPNRLIVFPYNFFADEGIKTEILISVRIRPFSIRKFFAAVIAQSISDSAGTSVGIEFCFDDKLY